MRLAFLVLSFNLLVAGCGSSRNSNQAPKQQRGCGELDGVEPVEPVVVGEHPLSLGLEGSCPIFEPVPCTSSLDDYASLCGPDCWPATGTHSSGDEWLIGCEYSLRAPCADLDYVPEPKCYQDPFDGDEYWYTYPSCPIILEALFCWTPCDPERRWPDPPEYCPAR
ncbi:MAG: hypothetical protein OEN21_01390 [Myxococcales bacterium]|nr:hypothetical protein [Myxococcales bacterium]